MKNIDVRKENREDILSVKLIFNKKGGRNPPFYTRSSADRKDKPLLIYFC
jgi:hypothetical protein